MSAWVTLSRYVVGAECDENSLLHDARAANTVILTHDAGETDQEDTQHNNDDSEEHPVTKRDK